MIESHASSLGKHWKKQLATGRAIATSFFDGLHQELLQADHAWNSLNLCQIYLYGVKIFIISTINNLASMAPHTSGIHSDGYTYIIKYHKNNNKIICQLNYILRPQCSIFIEKTWCEYQIFAKLLSFVSHLTTRLCPKTLSHKLKLKFNSSKVSKQR